MATGLGSAGMTINLNPACIARYGRPGQTRICVICAGIYVRICFSLTSERLLALQLPDRIVIPLPAADGYSCITVSSAAGHASGGGSKLLYPTNYSPRVSAQPILRRSFWPSLAPALTTPLLLLHESCL